ncbi:MAG: phosphotyrosine protein phosphatase [Actinomycetota bacterium]
MGLRPKETGMETNRPTVLFVCVHNAGRSQMAAAWLDHLAGGRVRVLSGGSLPAAAVNPAAVAAMAEVGLDISARVPRPWTEAAVQEADIVVTMGCGDPCPSFPEKRYVSWEVADPADWPLEQVRTVRDDIERRVRRLAEELGIGPA